MERAKAPKKQRLLASAWSTWIAATLAMIFLAPAAVAAEAQKCGIDAAGLVRLNCGRIEVHLAEGRCVVSGSGTNMIKTCGPFEWSGTVTAKDWVNPGTLTGSLTGPDGITQCGSQTKNDQWQGIPSDDGFVSFTLRIVCTQFIVTWGQCPGYSVRIEAWFNGSSSPGQVAATQGFFAGCVPPP